MGGRRHQRIPAPSHAKVENGVLGDSQPDRILRKNGRGQRVEGRRGRAVESIPFFPLCHFHSLCSFNVCFPLCVSLYLSPPLNLSPCFLSVSNFEYVFTPSPSP